MARKKAVRRRARTSFKRKSSRRKSGFGGGMMQTMLSAGIYGALRTKISGYIQPVVRNMPFGNIADETGLLLTAYMAKKFLGRKIPMLSKVANAGMVIESASIGQALASGQLGLGNTTPTAVQFQKTVF